MFPHLAATWLSAALKTPFFTEEIKLGMLVLLKIPCLKSLKITASHFCFEIKFFSRNPMTNKLDVHPASLEERIQIYQNIFEFEFWKMRITASVL